MFGICYSFWSVENLSVRFLFCNQFSMEMAGSETVNMPKSYALNMFKDFVPYSVKQTKVIDNDRGLHMRPMPGMVGLIASNFKEKKKATPVKAPEVKRTRRDRGELEHIMFKLFERQPNWAR
ncbi:putative transcription initiation factor IIF, beta subunit [Helianthus debilis subsp. tardiflorus]